MKTVLIICANNLPKAPRFLMEVNALKNDYHILAAGYNSKTNVDYEFIDLDIHKKSKEPKLDFHLNYPPAFRKVVSFFIRIIYFNHFYKQKNKEKIEAEDEFNLLKNQSFDIIIVHHIWQLPVAVKLAKLKQTKLIFNAHEYYPLEFDDDEQWMQTTHIKYTNICKANLPYVATCFCVGQKIAEKYKTEFNLNSVIITNAKPFYDLKPSPLKQGEKIKLIHHGGALRARGIELMMDMMPLLGEGYSLDLVLVPGDETYIEELKNKSSGHKNIRFMQPVKTDEIPAYTNKYDVGLFLLPPTNFNYTYALPNKLFEFIQARLAVAISPSPEMAEIVNKYDLGVVAEDFKSENLANKIKELSAEKIMHYKNQAHKYAKELSAEKNEALIKETVNKLLIN